MIELCRQRLGQQLFSFICKSAARAHLHLQGSQYTAARESRFMKKLITGRQKSKKKFYGRETGSNALQELSFLSSTVPTTRTEARQKPAKVSRRVNVLNAVFMEHITSILSTGEVASDILGLGMEITEVKVSPDFSCVNIYWFGTGTEKDEPLEEVLQGVGKKLRHVLSQLRVIGCVPPVQFIKDMKYSKLKEVQELLSKVDFGEDFVPTPLGVSLKAPPAPPPSWKKGSISKSLENNLLNLDDVDGNDADVESSSDASNESASKHPLSAENMRQDILGLDRASIMTKIVVATAKARRKLNRDLQQSRQPQPEPTTATDAPITIETKEQIKESARATAHRQDQFLNYLKKKRIAKQKDGQRTSTLAREQEFMEQERRERWLQSQGMLLDESELELAYKDEDFVDEENYDERDRSI